MEPSPGQDPTPAAAGSPAAPRGRYHWVMLALLWLIYTTFGAIQRSIAPLITPILADLRLSYTQMGFILGSWQLTYIAAAMIAGTITDRWGIRKSLLAGSIIMGFSASLRYLVQGFGGMLGAVALSGIGGPLISIGVPKAIAAWFAGRSRGTAMGFCMTGSWIGGIFALTLTNSLVMPLVGQSWRNTFLFYGGVTFLGAFIWWLLARDRGRLTTAGDSGMRLFGSLLKLRDVRIVMVLGILTFAILHAQSNWLPKILETSGFTPALAGLTSAIPLISGVPALVIIPPLVPARARGRFLAWCSLLTLVSLVVIMTVSGVMQVVALIVFGILISPYVPILTLVLMDDPDVGSSHLGAAMGLFYCISEVGGFAGPLVMGVVVDLTGTFQAGTFFFIALSVSLFFLSTRLKPRTP